MVHTSTLVARGLRSAVCGLRGPWCTSTLVARGLWSEVCGLWSEGSVVRGLWSKHLWVHDICCWCSVNPKKSLGRVRYDNFVMQQAVCQAPSSLHHKIIIPHASQGNVWVHDFVVGLHIRYRCEIGSAQTSCKHGHKTVSHMFDLACMTSCCMFCFLPGT